MRLKKGLTNRAHDRAHRCFSQTGSYVVRFIASNLTCGIKKASLRKEENRKVDICTLRDWILVFASYVPHKMPAVGTDRWQDSGQSIGQVFGLDKEQTTCDALTTPLKGGLDSPP